MKNLEVSFDERGFNLVWRALHDRERKLLTMIEQAGEESDDAALLANDVVYLRLYMDDLKRQAVDVLGSGAFSLDEGWVDLRDR